MKNNIYLLMLALYIPLLNFAQNPIIQTNYTADPAPMVYNDTVYHYTTHDEDNSVNGYFTMNNWLCYSTIDMVNWTDNGVVLSYTDFVWSRGDAWAGQCIQRNGKFYFYVPVNQINGGNAIGVAVSDKPTGPFKDAIGSPLLVGYGYIDPTVFIDNDGQAYLYWGNPDLYYVKLNEDMVSYDETVGIVKVPLTVESFGPRENTTERLTSYEEGPWFFKRNNLYYLLYPAGGVPEHLAYSTSTGPTGPWVYQDTIMHVFSGGAFTNHPGFIDFKGKSYLFYHSAALPGGGGFKRSVCVEEFEFNSDSTIPVIEATKSGVVQSVSNLNPFQWNKAATIAWEEGIETTSNSSGGVYVSDIDKNDYIKVRSVDFDTIGSGVFWASVACDTRAGVTKGGFIEIRLDSVEGTKLGSVPVSYTGGSDKWIEEPVDVAGDTGVHDVYFVFNGDNTGNLFLFDKWKFTEKSDSSKLVAVNAWVDTYKIDTVNGRNKSTIQIDALYSDGTKMDITSEVTYEFNVENLVTISGNKVQGIGYGAVTIKVTYNTLSDEVLLLIKNLESELSVKELKATPENFELYPGTKAPVEIMATFLDEHTEVVTDSVTITNPSEDIAVLENGIISAKSKGSTTIIASYKGKLGESKSVSIYVNVVNLSPYKRNEAEDYSEQSGIQSEASSDVDGGNNIGFIENGDWIKINGLDFENGASGFSARVASATSGGNIEIRTDSPTGTLVGTCTISGTGGWQNWVTTSCEVSELSGIHDIYLIFTGNSGYLFNLNWWVFQATSSLADYREEPTIKIISSQHEKYLKGLHPDDVVTMYNAIGQLIKTSKANSESLLLDGANGIVIIEVDRKQKKYILKALL